MNQTNERIEEINEEKKAENQKCGQSLVTLSIASHDSDGMRNVACASTFITSINHYTL